MTYVRTFDNAAPPATTGGVIFTVARIREAPDVSGAPGTWTTLEDKVVAAYDTSAPPDMDFTTTLATLAAGWYSIQWRTAAGSSFDGDAVYFPAASTSIDLCTLAYARTHAQIPATETEQDDVIADLITSWSRFLISRYAEFAPPVSAVARTYSFDARDRLAPFSAPWNLRSATAVTIDSGLDTQQVLVSSQWRLALYDSISSSYLGIELDRYVLATSTWSTRTLTVTGNWGYASIPEDVQELCARAVTMTLRGEVQAFGSALQPNSIGDGVNEPNALPPGLRGLVLPHTRRLS